MTGSHVTAIPMPTVSTDGLVVSVTVGPSTGSLNGPDVTIQEYVSREYVDIALKAVQEAFREELRQDIRRELDGDIR